MSAGWDAADRASPTWYRGSPLTRDPQNGSFVPVSTGRAWGGSRIAQGRQHLGAGKGRPLNRRRAEMGETYVTLWGNIATDPKSLTTAAGVRITKFRLACTASRRDQQTGDFVDG